MQDKKTKPLLSDRLSLLNCLQENTVTGRKTMIYPPNKLNQDKSHRKGRRETPLPNKNKIIGSMNQKGQEHSMANKVYPNKQ